MSAILQSLTPLAAQLLRLSNRRPGACLHCHGARSYHLRVYALRHRNQLPRQYAFPIRSISRSPLASSYARNFHSAYVLSKNTDNSWKQEKPPPAGPKPGGSDPNEVFTDMDVLSGVPPPASAIEVVYEDGFLLSNGMKFRGGEGLMIVHNEAFNWITKDAAKVSNGMLELDDELWGILDIVAPKPELLVLGTGARNLPVSPKTKGALHQLGIRIDSMDTSNAASSYNLLATERPGTVVACAMLSASFR